MSPTSSLARVAVGVAIFFACAGKEPPVPVPPSEVVGWINDPAGDGVPFARLGSAGADEHGVAIGALATGTWLPVEAPGFVPAVAKTHGTRLGRALFEARLVPRDVTALVPRAEPTTLGTAGGRAKVSFDAAFADDAVVSLTWLDDRFVDFAEAPFSDARRLTLRGAVALEVVGVTSGQPLALASGKTLRLEVRDQGVLADPTLADFDAATGTWRAGAGTCARVDAVTMGCTVTRAATWLGLFGPRGSAGLRVHSGARGLPGEDDYADRQRKLDGLLSDWFFDHPGGGSWADLPQDVRDALEDLADAAEAMANATPTEAVKGHVLRVAEQATLLGSEGLAARMLALGTRIAEDVARQALEGDCTAIARMLTALEQLILFDGSAALQQELREKIEKVEGRCGTWVGTVDVTIPLTSQWPGAGDALVRASGATSWTEHFKFDARVDLDSGAIDGALSGTVTYGQVQYEQRDGDTCQPTFKTVVKGAPLPANAQLGFTGTQSRTEQGFEVSFGALEPFGGGSMGLEMHQVAQAEVDEHCETLVDQTFNVLGDFHAFLHSGFGGSTPITLQGMVAASARTETSFTVQFKGSAMVPTDAPESAYPVADTAQVRWQFAFIKGFP